MMAGTYEKNQEAASRARLLHTYELTEEHSRVSLASGMQCTNRPLLLLSRPLLPCE